MCRVKRIEGKKVIVYREREKGRRERMRKGEIERM